MILTDVADIRPHLARVRHIAVLGAHTDPSRAAFYVPDYLGRQGYAVRGVNPAQVGREVWGAPIVGELAEADDFDMVLVFRAPAALPAHLPELVAHCRPGTLVWFQTGIVNDAVAAALSAAGLVVVQDRCAMVDHKHWGIGAVHD